MGSTLRLRATAVHRFRHGSAQPVTSAVPKLEIDHERAVSPMKARCTTGDWRAMLDDSNEPVTSEDDIDVSRSSDRVWLEVAILTSAPDAPHEGPADAGEPLDLSARIAIVARDPELRAYIRDCLGATAFRLIEAADLASAASADGRPIADLLILDLSGLDAAEREQLAQSAFARLP
ncbi:MAG: hypothetical protein ACRETX_16975, partial [Steroidobacteraceae bacterium]